MMDKQINVFMRVSVFLFILLAYTSVSHGQNPVTLERVKKATSPKKDNKHNSTTPLRGAYSYHNQKKENSSNTYKKTILHNQEIVIEGTLKNGTNKTIYIKEMSPESLIFLDSIRLDAKGHFIYRYAMPYKTFINVYVSDNDYIVLLPDMGEKIVLYGDYSSLATSYNIDSHGESRLLWKLQNFSNKGTKVLKNIVATDTKNRQLLANGDMSQEEYDHEHSVTDSIYIAAYAEQQQYVVHFIEDNLGSLTTLVALYKTFNNHPLIDPSNSFEFYEAVLEGLQKYLPDNPHTLYFKNTVERIHFQKEQ